MPHHLIGSRGSGVKRFAGVTLLVAALSGCSTISSQFAASPVDDPSVQSVLVSYNRSTLGRTDYEQFRVLSKADRSGGDIIWECGRIAAGRYNPQSQEVTALSATQLAKITAHAAELRRLVAEKGAQFQEPGSTPEFFDPGQYSAKVEAPGTEHATISVRTTFDSVALPQANREFVLNKLTLAIRGPVLEQYPNGPCGIRDFYLLAPAKR